MNKKVWLVSDTHFFHKNIINFCRKEYLLTKEDIDKMAIDMRWAFLDENEALNWYHNGKNIGNERAARYKDMVDENIPDKQIWKMHEDMIKIWNESVGKEDIVIHLGDVALGVNNKESKKELKKLFSRLNGYKMLLPGNHDRAIIEADRHFFNDIGFMNVEVNTNKIVINDTIFTHEPMEIIPEGYENVHGHVHNGITAALYGADERRFNVCWDHTDFKMVNALTVLGSDTVEKILEIFERKQND